MSLIVYLIFHQVCDLPYHHVPEEFSPNAFWYELSGDYRYDTTNSKGMVNRNPCIRVAQWLLACSLFVKEDSLMCLACFEL